MIKPSDNHFIPALHFAPLTRCYDACMRLFLPERRFKNALIDLAHVAPGQAALDFGCGTGTLTLMIAERVPGTRVTGIDVDPAVLRIAERKRRARGADVRFERYDGTRLPYPDGTFDAVVSSLVIHHIPPERRPETFRDLLRVLRPGGVLALADIGVPAGRLMAAVAALLKRLEPVEENIRGLLPAHMTAAGFTGVRTAARFNTAVGTIALYEGRKPSG